MFIHSLSNNTPGKMNPLIPPSYKLNSNTTILSCLNFWDEAWWFLSLRVFGLLSSSLLFFPQRFGRYVLQPFSGVCCLNFWKEAWWFLSLRVFRLLSSFLLFFPQHFGWYILQPSSCVCQTQEPTRNFELHPLLNPRGSPVLILLAITGYKC